MLRWLFWVLLLPIWFPWRLLRALIERARPPSALVISLKGSLPDTPARSGPFGSQEALLPILESLRECRTDQRLKWVVVLVDNFAGGLGRAEELRQALNEAKLAGKQVVVVADALSLSGYWLALGASRIVVSPAGSLDVAGVASEFTLVKGLLDKLGIRASLKARGKYKSMREMFCEEQMSAANREMVEALVANLYEQLCTRISSARNIPKERVAEVLDQGPFRAERALSYGLVDQLTYRGQLTKEFDDDKTFRAISPRSYLKRRRRSWLPKKRKRVAVLHVEGSIGMGDDSFGSSGKRSTGARSFVRLARRIERDRHIDAILLRVNSPGGSALASDLMHDALTRAKGDRPLVVSMVNVAASGGYYVSGVKGAVIFANSCTVTGSIGVLGGKLDVSALLEKLGVRREVVSRGVNADFHSPTSEWSPAQLAKMESDIDALYEDFVAKMAHGRGISKADLETAAQGRVWTGSHALSHRLVDQLGGLLDAQSELEKVLSTPSDARLSYVHYGKPSLPALLRSRLNPTSLLTTRLGVDELVAESSPRQLLWCRLPFDLRFD